MLPFSKDLYFTALEPFIKRNSLFNNQLNLFTSIKKTLMSHLSSSYDKQILFYNIGLIQKDNYLFNDAIDSFSNSIYERPEYIPALIMRALCYLKKGKMVQAYEDAALSALYEPNLSITHFIQSYISYKRNDCNIALDSIKKALELKNDDPYYHLLCAKIFDKLNQPINSIKELQEASNINNDSYFKFELGKYLINQNQVNDGIKILKKIKNYALSDFILAKTLFATQKTEAKNIFIKLLKNSRFRDISLYYITRIHIENRNYKSAEKILSRLSLKYHSNYTILELFAKMLYLNGRYDMAEKIIKLAEKIFLLSKNKSEQSISLLITRIKILLKTKKIDREKILIPLKTFENLIKNDNSKNILLERFYIKLYRKFEHNKDLKKIKDIRKIKGKLTDTSYYIDQTGKLKKRTIIISAVILIIVIILIIINSFNN